MIHDLFEGLVGQVKAKEMLSEAVANESLPQTLIFAGPAGVGKVTCAKLLAKYLHGEADGLADTFVFSEILAEVRERGEKSPFMAAARRMINFLTRSPIASKRKVAIIDEAEELSDASQNALLKTLEEPRSDTMLIITVSDETLLLPTILSRARLIKFGPLTDAEIQAVADVDGEILKMAQGSLGFVKEMMSDAEGWQGFKEMMDFWEQIKTKDVVERFAWANKKQLREDALQFVRIGILVFRDTLMKKPEAQRALDILRMQGAVEQIRDNVNVRLSLEALLLVI